ncbi:hypothetical protein [Devosia aquimaris]|uniref:hypothetical protein n=1 Tax=Devosia aquimaris TaxID=2866214 RepID=UPI001CD0DBFC|nr:hypothetical protein [Devosia sp. CJK-A8-3]
MSSFLLTNVLDTARALGPDPFSATPKSVHDWFLEQYLNKRGGRFNYDPAFLAAYDLFRGAVGKDEAIRYCLSNGNPKGREQNASAVKSIADYALANVSVCHKIGFLAVEVGRASGKSVFVGIKAPFIRIDGRSANLVMPGFRMSHEPSEREIDVACAITSAHLARDDYEEADIEYLYAGPGGTGKRSFRSILGRDRRLPSIDEVDRLLQVYVEGIDMLIRSGESARSPNFRGYQKRSFDQPGFAW